MEFIEIPALDRGKVCWCFQHLQLNVSYWSPSWHKITFFSTATDERVEYMTNLSTTIGVHSINRSNLYDDVTRLFERPEVVNHYPLRIRFVGEMYSGPGGHASFQWLSLHITMALIPHSNSHYNSWHFTLHVTMNSVCIPFLFHHGIVNREFP